MVQQIKRKSQSNHRFHIPVCLSLFLLISTQTIIAQSQSPLPNSVAAAVLESEAAQLRRQGDDESLRKAIAKYEEAMRLLRDAGEVSGEANSLVLIGETYDELGEKKKAQDSFIQALTLWRVAGDGREEIETLGKLGKLWIEIGELSKTIEYFNRALSIARAENYQEEEATALNNIGLVHFKLGETQEALDYYNQSLDLRLKLKDSHGEAVTLNNIGQVFDSRGKHQEALLYYEKSLPLLRALEDRYGEAIALNNIGKAFSSLGEKEKALDYHRQSLAISRAIGVRTIEAIALANIARVQRELNNYSEAQTRIEEALKIIETLRARIDDQDLCASYFATVQKHYEFYIDLLMQLDGLQPDNGFNALALEACERARARSLLDLLTKTRISKNANSVAATQAITLDLSEIQRLLDSDTILLEYALGDERSYLWAVTSETLTSFKLPERSKIEKVARHVYELLTSHNIHIQSGTTAQKRARTTKADFQLFVALEELSRMILPTVATLLGKKRLVIVADGALQYIPFAALPVVSGQWSVVGDQKNEKQRPKAKDQRPGCEHLLIFNHEIIPLPSASTLAVLRRDLSNRRPAPKIVAVFADPVFTANDERVRSISIRTKTLNSQLESKSKSDGDSEELLSYKKLPRLLYTRLEAEGILSFVPAGKWMKATDFDANRELAVSGALDQYRIVHFASHAIVDSSRPDLSGIVLSIVNERGQHQNGFLKISDIFNLKLSADLVVLSACRTALGKEIRGEGLVGITRGFMYAGAPRVVVSLWDVSDKETAELMIRFYRNMLGKKSMTPTAALRAAQLEILKDKRWQSPYFWAAFVLQGEWL